MSRWWDGISLRTKITGITVLLVALGLLVAGLGTMTVLSTYLMAQLDNNVRQTTEQLEGQNISDGEQYCKLSVVLSQSAYVAAYDSAASRSARPRRRAAPTSTNSTSPPRRRPVSRFSLYDSQHDHEWRAQVIPHRCRTSRPAPRSRVRPGRGVERRHRPDRPAVHRHLPELRRLGDPARAPCSPDGSSRRRSTPCATSRTPRPVRSRGLQPASKPTPRTPRSVAEPVPELHARAHRLRVRGPAAHHRPDAPVRR